MKYEKVVDMDLNNGDGIGVTLWVTGCPHHCYGCHNKILWDENRGKEDYIEALSKIRKALSDDRIDKHLSVLGGEPLAPYNIDEVTEIVRIIRQEFPDKKIWLWTGYELEELNTKQRSILQYLDYIIVGRFDITNKCENRYYGSTNQRLIDLHKSRWDNKIDATIAFKNVV